MSTVVRCDRCRSEGCQMTQIVGKDLCNECIADFGRWVLAGIEAPFTGEKMRRGAYSAAIRRLIARDGCVTPDTLAQALNTTRSRAHDALRFEKRQGRIWQDGRSRYVAKQDADTTEETA